MLFNRKWFHPPVKLPVYRQAPVPVVLVELPQVTGAATSRLDEFEDGLIDYAEIYGG
jgi:hypothetical protein